MAISASLLVAASCVRFGSSTDPTPASPDTLDASARDGDASLIDAGGPGCPATSIFCDDFEGYVADAGLAGTKWSALPGAGVGSIDAALAFSPSHSLKIEVPVGKTERTVGVSVRPKIGSSGITLHAAMHISAAPAYAQLISMVIDGRFFAVVCENGTFVAQYQDAAKPTSYVRTDTLIPIGRWFQLAYELKFGPLGGVRLSIDGESIYSSKAETTGTATVTSFELLVQPNLGSVTTTAPMTFNYDDVRLE